MAQGGEICQGTEKTPAVFSGEKTQMLPASVFPDAAQVPSMGWGLLISGSPTQDGCLPCAAAPCVAVFLLAML